ncbi:MAG: methyltransferase domain-containing protein [Candidatus Rokubacteria bacterium]|nr:methyltransferase domain-containing protein [Candidatus Rokubacteria bacterium]
MEWSEVLTRQPVRLHLGGAGLCEPHPNYRGYVAVDLSPREGTWGVRHDLREPLPIPDGSVDRLHSEDFIEHLERPALARLLAEAYRVLRSGGMMRIGCPDYDNPKDRAYAAKGYDDRYPLHVTFTTAALIRELIEASPFTRYDVLAHWDRDRFISRPIDYALGYVRRTPDNDIRCRIFRAGDTLPVNLARWVKITAQDLAYAGRRGFRVSRAEMLSRPDRRWHVTSLVIDLFKD